LAVSADLEFYRNRIVATIAPRIASGYTKYPHCKTFKKPMLLESFRHIFRTRRIIAAHSGKKGGYDSLV